MDTTHKKHASLARPAYGEFHRREWGILGAPCGQIRKLAFALTEQLAGYYRLGYADADHAGADAEARQGRDANSVMGHGAYQEYTDKITYHRYDLEGNQDAYRQRWWFNGVDAVLVNGNHFGTQRQIVIIDPRKEESLKKKLDRLTDVQLILLADGVETVYPFLLSHLPDTAAVPVMRLEDTERIAGWLREQLAAARPPLNGLVLAGGQSRRMGRDKGMIDYHGKPQREHAADLLNAVCAETFLSCRPDQADELAGAYPTLPDTFTGLGPFGAILSAFRAFPDHAWLVVATDLPLLDSVTLAQLTAKRNPSKLATAFRHPDSDWPEPLVTIWEPRGYPVLLQFLAQGYSCPRKALINSDIELVEAANPDALTNVNDPEEWRVITEKLNNRLTD